MPRRPHTYVYYTKGSGSEPRILGDITKKLYKMDTECPVCGNTYKNRLLHMHNHLRADTLGTKPIMPIEGTYTPIYTTFDMSDTIPDYEIKYFYSFPQYIKYDGEILQCMDVKREDSVEYSIFYDRKYERVFVLDRKLNLYFQGRFIGSRFVKPRV